MIAVGSIIICLLAITGISTYNRKHISKSYADYRKGKSPVFVVVLLFVFGVILCTLPLLITNLSWIPFTYQNTGEIGDIIGGSTAPFIGFIGVLVTFFAFWVQFKSNIQQAEDISKERFENQYYEMLRLHKENVQEMEIANVVSGRKCFVRMFYEFRFIYLQMFGISKAHRGLLGKEYTLYELCDLSYKLFFNGIGNQSDDTILTLFQERDHALITLVRDVLFKIQNGWYQSTLPNGAAYEHKGVNSENSNTCIVLEILYFPFDGNASRLGHYYRHLFQTVSFVAESKLSFDRAERYRYLKLLRAQLSDHEQLLLYYNGLVSFGHKWIDNGYFDNFRMVKNIPFMYANFGVRPNDKFPELNLHGERIFEWGTTSL